MIPDNPIQAPEISTLPPDTVPDAATAAFAQLHLGTNPKSNRRQPNVKRTRQEEINASEASEPDLSLSDTEVESVDEVHGEKLDNCPQELANWDYQSTNGPRSIKTVSF